MKYLYLIRNIVFALMISIVIFRYFFLSQFDVSYEAMSHYLLGVTLVCLAICQFIIFVLKRRS